VSGSEVYPFTVDADRALVANFVPTITIAGTYTITPDGLSSGTSAQVQPWSTFTVTVGDPSHTGPGSWCGFAPDANNNFVKTTLTAVWTMSFDGSGGYVLDSLGQGGRAAQHLTWTGTYR
jgi:hypothetical protein